MNLITRFTILFIIVSAIVFVVGGMISYKVIAKEIKSEERRFLMTRYQGLLEYLQRHQVEGFTRNKTSVQLVPMETPLHPPSFSDTLIVNEHYQHPENQIKLYSVAEVNGRRYRIVQYDLIVESDDIIHSVTKSMLITFFILLGSLAFIAILISYYMFAPFRVLLSKIQKFSLKDPEPIDLSETNIKEFNHLNHFLMEMTSKMITDYQSLKEFTENASHELQTPIAIIQGKLDNLLDEMNLTSEQVSTIISMQNTVNRLSKLTSSLSLLTKIDNHEFNQVEALDLSKMINELLPEYDELISLKEIKLEWEVTDQVSIVADKVLLQILLTNLINNAIRHNIESGRLVIQLTANYLLIRNSGDDLDVAPLLFFERFKKSNQGSNSLGLGLAIVKKICEIYSFTPDYQMEKGEHILTITF